MKFTKTNISRDNSIKISTSYSNSSSTSGSSSSSGGSASTITPHTFWGQTYDGTQDVSGDMTNVGSITASGNIQTSEDFIITNDNANLEISADDESANFKGKDKYIFDGSINAPQGSITEINSTTINNSGELNTDQINANSGNVTTLSTTNITNSDTIKTKNLEVTGSAHFFELIIDKVKAAGGAVLFTPADGFEIDIVEQVTNGYRLYWQCQDGDGNQRDNMWKVNDQALCQSFNQAKSGISHEVTNKYYWCLVTEVSDNANPILKDEQYYHYITISNTVFDGTVNPEKGDSISMLGYRGTDDSKRQSAMYISAYTSLDKGLTAPLMAQYRGINDFNLESHRQSYYDAVGAKFVGNFEVQGKTIEEYIKDQIEVSEGGTPYIGDNGNWFIWDSTTKKYKDSGIKAEGYSVTILSSSITYAITTEYKQPNDLDFIYDSFPTNASDGNYIWSKTIVTYSDGTVTKTYNVSKMGKNTEWYNFTNDYDSVNYDPTTREYLPSIDEKIWNWHLYKHNGDSITEYKYNEVEDNVLFICNFTDGHKDWALLEDSSYNSLINANGWSDFSNIKAVYYPNANLNDLDNTTLNAIMEANGDGTKVDGFNQTPSAQTELICINKAQSGVNGVSYSVNLSRGIRVILGSNVSVLNFTFVKSDGANITSTGSIHNIDSTASVKIYCDGIINNEMTTAINNNAEYLDFSSYPLDDVETISVNMYLGNIIVATANYDLAKQGQDAIIYGMIPTYEYSILDSDGELYTLAEYIIYKQVGETKTQLTPTLNGYHVEYKTYSSWIDATITNGMCVINDQANYKNIEEPLYVSVRLMNGETELDKKIIIVTYKPSATLSINQELGTIETKIQGYDDTLSELSNRISINTNNISSLQQTSSLIRTQVTSNTNAIDNLSGKVTNLSSDVSTISQKADSIESSVTSVKKDLLGDNILTGLNGDGWSGYVNNNNGTFFFNADEWTQSAPFKNQEGDYTFSFAKTNTTASFDMEVYEFEQPYNIAQTYQIECDFGDNEYTTKVISDLVATDSEITSKYGKKGYRYTYTLTDSTTITSTYVAVRISNGSQYYYIYGNNISQNENYITVQTITRLPYATLCFSANFPSDLTDDTELYKFHNKDGRYWIRWKEINTKSKTYIMRFKGNTSIYNLMLEEAVSEPHKYSESSYVSQSTIKQTADNILLSVNDTFVRVGDGNITLNGDTQINGSLTIEDNTNGFILKGDDGTTEIMPKSVGTYEEFKSKTNTTISTSFRGQVISGQVGNVKEIDFNWENTTSLGTIGKGKYLQFTDFTTSISVDDNFRRITQCYFQIYEGTTLMSSTYISNVSKKDSITTYTTASNSEVIIKLVCQQQETYSDTVPSSAYCNYFMSFQTIQPIDGKYMLIGYDGIGVNFGTNKTVFIGNDGLYGSYGDTTFKVTDTDIRCKVGTRDLHITDDGINQVNRRNVYVLNGTTDTNLYTVKDPIDTILCIGSNCGVLFPDNPYVGQVIKIYDKSKNTYVWSNNKYVMEPSGMSDSMTKYDGKELGGNGVWLFTYMNNIWYKSFEG